MPVENKPKPWWVRMGVGLLAGLVLWAVFMLYQDPVFLLAVADTLWTCF